ncbi:MAG: hypothetical protein K1X51_14450 [Rhodospirillaceae bacterium]|nr:hypothetical protein [Rhodospirillaceae bacterium]
MGVLLGSILLIAAAAGIVFGIKTGRAPVPVFSSIVDLFLPLFADRRTNPGGFLASMLGWVLVAFVALLIVIFSAL